MAVADASRPPWQPLPADLADRLAPVVPAVADRIIRTVPDEIPAYADARDGGYGRKIALGVRTALDRLLSLPGTALPALDGATRALMASLGEGEFREGRTMEHLFSAYRLAARIAFRDLSEECARLDLGLTVVVDLGESIWAYIDELSSVSTQAYAAAQSVQAGVLERRRADLASTLVAARGGPADVEHLSVVADWPLPELLAVAVLPPDGAAAARASLGRSGLVLEREHETLAVVAAARTPGERRRLLASLAGTGAVVGPAVPWREAPYSVRVARTLAVRRHALAGVDDGAPVLAEDHLGAVVLGSEPDVVALLARRVLAPLDELTPAKRAVLEETLAVWLAHWGQRAQIAERLSVHPQTVGYRVGRLRELFGDALEDPDARFDLELALRARGAGAR